MNFFKSLFTKNQQSAPSNQDKTELTQNQSTQNQHAYSKEINQLEIPAQIIQQFFNLSVKFISKSKVKVTDQQKLNMYGLYKQAISADCNTPKPALYDIVNRSKWNAWDQNRGMSQQLAKKNYIVLVKQIDGDIAEMIRQEFERQQGKIQQQQIVEDKTHKAALKNQPNYLPSGSLKNRVEEVDYSDSYSHPYFGRIEKAQQIPFQQINHQLLMTKNSAPAVYPLHFAIDKERPELVQRFLTLLTAQEIESMVDEEGTGILQYAELMENQDILVMVRSKLSKQ